MEYDLYAVFYKDNGYYCKGYTRSPSLKFLQFILEPSQFGKCFVGRTEYFKLIISNVALETHYPDDTNFIITLKAYEKISTANNRESIDNILDDFILPAPLTTLTKTFAYGNKLGINLNPYNYGREYTIAKIERLTTVEELW